MDKPTQDAAPAAGLPIDLLDQIAQWSGERAAQDDHTDDEALRANDEQAAELLLAVAEATGAHAARPCDCPDEDHDCCKDCEKPVTWIGPSQYDWQHVSA